MRPGPTSGSRLNSDRSSDGKAGGISGQTSSVLMSMRVQAPPPGLPSEEQPICSATTSTSDRCTAMFDVIRLLLTSESCHASAPRSRQCSHAGSAAHDHVNRSDMASRRRWHNRLRSALFPSPSRGDEEGTARRGRTLQWSVRPDARGAKRPCPKGAMGARCSNKYTSGLKALPQSGLLFEATLRPLRPTGTSPLEGEGYRGEHSGHRLRTPLAQSLALGAVPFPLQGG
jgi:hypothetical protein